MKDEPQHRHKDAAAAPTVIHDYQGEETLLAQWLRKGMEKGAGFWLLVLGAVVVLTGAFYVINGLASTPPKSSQAWLDVMVNSEGGDVPEKYKDYPTRVQPLLRAADEYPDTPAAAWARYQAGLYLYQDGLRDLPNNRDAAKPALKQAYDLFEEVVDSAAKDDPVRQMALMAQARTLETRGELSEAREKYTQVAEEYPDVAKVANERAERLGTPEAKTFYEDFYAQDFSSFMPDSPPGFGTGGGLPAGHPPIGTPMIPPALPGFGESAPPAGAGTPPAEPPAGALPELPPPAGTTPPSAPEESKETPPAETPAPPAGDLPKDVFVPSEKDKAEPKG